MNKELYKSAVDHLPFRQDFETSVIDSVERGEKPRPEKKMPASIRRSAEIAAVAACLAVIALFLFPMLQNNRIKLPHSSSGVSARIVKSPDLDGQEIPLPAGLTEEEQFARADAILSGTVKKTETIEITTGNDVFYRSLITVHTEKVWRGAVSADSNVKILLPYAIDENNNTAGNVLSQIRTGMRGIFLMQTYTKDSLYADGNETLAFMDLAPYGLPDDSCALLEKDGGVVYRTESFPGLKANTTFDEACAYITDMLNTLQTVAADTTTQTAADNVTTDTASHSADATKSNGGASQSKSGTTATKQSEPEVSNYDYIFPENDTGYYYRIAKDGTAEKINLPDKDYFTFITADDEWVYFYAYRFNSDSSTIGGIYRCRPDGSDFTAVYTESCPLSYVFIKDSFYICKDKALYKMNKDGSNLTKLWKLPTIFDASMKNDGKYFYSIANSNGKGLLYKISISDGSYKSIYSWDGVTTDLVTVSGDWIYIVSSDYSGGEGNTQNVFKRIRKDGTKETTLASGRELEAADVDNGYLYYMEMTDNRIKNGLYRVPVDVSSKPQTIKKPGNANDWLSCAFIENNHLYVWYSKDLYRMNPDGSNAVFINKNIQ